MADDVVSGAVQYLLAQSSVVAALGSFPVGHPWYPQPYLFQRELFQRMEGTSSQACVLSYAGGWSPPERGSQAVFSRLSVEIWVDPLRDSSGNVTNPTETEARGRTTWKVLDSFLQWLDPDARTWGNLVLCGSERLTEPVLYAVPDGDGLLRAQWFYGLEEVGNLTH